MKYVLNNCFHMHIAIKLLLTLAVLLLSIWTLLAGPEFVYDTVTLYEGTCNTTIIEENVAEVDCNGYVSDESFNNNWALVAVEEGYATMICIVTRREDSNNFSTKCEITNENISN